VFYDNVPDDKDGGEGELPIQPVLSWRHQSIAFLKGAFNT